ncbi:phage tail assembly protein [Novosphingobium sp. KN65.2]|uniref:phage tail assembly protein n=1 Tax=Novosphingobium sp. KN65.2 TaxID=1478134 RepID=UPI0005DD5E90|nr:phage tail assembly protein [Novosphingobium sp. KN65.2]CDO35817.1 Phage tail protein E (modular protein) [Novosphingobium sp. KN65.2]
MAETDIPEPKTPQTVTITLSEPISRKGGDITELTLRKPRTGELRGLKVEDLFATDVNALMLLIPRISSPALIGDEVGQLETEDLIEVAGTVKGFFMTAAMKAAVAKAFGG